MSWKRKQYEMTQQVQSKPLHRVYCIDCGRPKLLFKGMSKALNFIKFNGDAIETESGFRPIRVYKCVCCCGWHVTSHAKRVGVRSKAEKLLCIDYDELKEKSVYFEP